MLEQKSHSTEDAANGQAQSPAPTSPPTMTQLEGIRHKVFMDRYSLKDPNGNPLEFYPEQLWARVARGIAAVEQTDEKRAEWEKLFYEALTNFQFVPGGRILAGAGTGHQVTYYNCMPPDQEVLTANGYRPIADIKLGDLVVTHRNRLRPVLHKFERETEEPLYIIRPKKMGYDDLRVTGEHKIYIVRSEWVNKHKSRDGLRLQHEPDWIPAKDIKVGDYVAIIHNGEEFPPNITYIEYDNLKWVQIDEVAVEDYSGTVLDIEVEEDHSFVSAGIVASNCFVIPSPEDSRQGILDNLKVMTEIMARGGGVGINLSSLRPRGSYIKTVNGTASGPCSWAQLYSVATGDVIQQGGCFGPNERIATDKGLIPALELANRLDSGEVIQAQTHKGLRSFTSVFRNGTKDLYEVTTSRGYQVQVTLDHKMGVLRDGEIVTIPLRELEEGDEVLLLLGEGSKNADPLPLSATPYLRPKMSTTLNENVILPTHLTPDLAYVLGYAYGDGYVIMGKKVTWQDEKGLSLATADAYPEIRERLVTSLRTLFGIEPIIEKGDGACANVKLYSRIVIEWLQENGLLKAKAEHIRVPEAIFRAPSEVIGAFIAGYFDADGCDRGKKGGYGIDSVSLEMLQDIQLLLISHGIVSHIAVQDRTQQGWKHIYRLIVTGAQFKKRFSQFMCSCKDQQGVGYRSHHHNYPMEVWKPLGIPGRYYPGLFDSTKERVSHYALTRVRERVLAAGGVAMIERLDALLGVLPDTIISIDPLGPSEVYDFEVEDVHLLAGGGLYVSNSRRGALMLMLDDTHPDIEEFITVKRTAGKIEHANLSVCISDAFMQAVKDNTEWKLTWQGEVKKTIRARALWDLICTSAWESAEPGMVFMDRYNTESNTWYYENIRCVNPCVTGDTLVAVADGRHAVSIRQLAIEGKDVPLYCCDPKNGKIHIRMGRHPRKTREQTEVWKLILDNGSTFRATPDHKMRLRDGTELMLKDLQPGNNLMSFDAGMEKQPEKSHKVVTSEFDGYEDVYNITVDEFHTVAYLTSENSGICSSNCGEQGLPPFGVCNLGAINLSSFVKNDTMDWEQLARISKIAMRFLDNVVDSNEYFIPENREAQLGTRRTGLGTMGLADALIKMKIAYGSEASLPVIERIYSTIRDAAYEASADNALEKGAFPNLDSEKYMQGKFIQRLPKHIQKKIRQYGTRNAVLLTQAPTGTTSLLAGVSSGIEPVYDFAMIRRDRTGEHILYHPLLQEWRDAHSNEVTPDYFVSSKDLSPEEHVRVQAMVQCYTDSSISKTVNAPNHHTVEEVQTLYRLAYEMGCKGVTYYRDGSRDAVLTRVEDEKKAAEASKQTETPQAPTIEMVTSIHEGIKQRPAVVQGYTRQVRAPEGKINITINSDEQGPFEVFVNVGKAGSDIAALSEALGRLISLNLQLLSPLSPVDRAQEITNQLRGIGGSRSVGFGVQQVRSLPDAVARALELHIETLQSANNTTAQMNGNHAADEGTGVGQAPTQPAHLSKLPLTGNLCSKCGCHTMVYEEGCRKCYGCGHSEC